MISLSLERWVFAFNVSDFFAALNRGFSIFLLSIHSSGKPSEMYMPFRSCFLLHKIHCTS